MQLYANTTLTSYAFHAQKKCSAYNRNCTHFCKKIENIKARCAPMVYIMLQRSHSTKRPTR